MSSTTLRIDRDGLPYWNQFEGTSLVYGFNWAYRMAAIAPLPTILTAQISTDTESMSYGPSVFAYNIHAFYVTPSAGNVDEDVVFTSKVFLSDGQVDKARIKVKVKA